MKSTYLSISKTHINLEIRHTRHNGSHRMGTAQRGSQQLTPHRSLDYVLSLDKSNQFHVMPPWHQNAPERHETAGRAYKMMIIPSKEACDGIQSHVSMGFECGSHHSSRLIGSPVLQKTWLLSIVSIPQNTDVIHIVFVNYSSVILAHLIV